MNSVYQNRPAHPAIAALLLVLGQQSLAVAEPSERDAGPVQPGIEDSFDAGAVQPSIEAWLLEEQAAFELRDFCPLCDAEALPPEYWSGDGWTMLDIAEPCDEWEPAEPFDDPFYFYEACLAPLSFVSAAADDVIAAEDAEEDAALFVASFAAPPPRRRTPTGNDGGMDRSPGALRRAVAAVQTLLQLAEAARSALVNLLGRAADDLELWDADNRPEAVEFIKLLLGTVLRQCSAKCLLSVVGWAGLQQWMIYAQRAGVDLELAEARLAAALALAERHLAAVREDFAAVANKLLEKAGHDPIAPEDVEAVILLLGGGHGSAVPLNDRKIALFLRVRDLILEEERKPNKVAHADELREAARIYAASFLGIAPLRMR